MTKLQKEILNLLQEDARFTTKKIAQITNCSVDEIEQNIDFMEKTGIIVGYTAIANTDMFEKDRVQALIEINVTPEKTKGFDSIAEEICEFEEVEGVFLTSGKNDLTIIVNGKSLNDISIFVSEKIAPLKNVISTTTNFVLKKYKIENKHIQQKKDTREVVNP